MRSRVAGSSGCRTGRAIAAYLFVSIVAGPAAFGQHTLLDGFDYADTAAARAVWAPQAGSPEVNMVNGTLELPCNFSTQTYRCYWDRSVGMDLSRAKVLALEVYVADPAAAPRFTIYFRSGNGWFIRSENLPATVGWHTLYYHRADFAVDSTNNPPQSWTTIDRIRLSIAEATGYAQDATYFVRELRVATPVTLDAFEYADSAAAQAQWTPGWQAGYTAPAVEMVTTSGVAMKFPCNFSVQTNRCYWDRPVGLDLTASRRFAMELFVDEPAAASSITMYFRTGTNGWYRNSAAFSGTRGWQTLYFSRSGFTTEGAPLGWDRVDRIRIAIGRGAGFAADAYYLARDLRAFFPDVAILRDNDSASQTTVASVVAQHETWLSRYGLSYGVMTNGEVTSRSLVDANLAILPYNTVLSETVLTEIERFVGAGGRLMVYYNLHSRIAALLGVRQTGWTSGEFRSYAFSDATIAHLPEVVNQSSGNSTIAEPNSTALHARTIAIWANSYGVSLGVPAWIASDTGLFMSHVLYAGDNDAESKPQMLLALLGHYAPSVWELARAPSIDRIGQIANYATYNEAVAGISARSTGSPQAAAISDWLSLAADACGETTNASAEIATAAAREARLALRAAYTLSAQSAGAAEFRGIWEHSGTGSYTPGDWATTLDRISAAGFNQIVANLFSGGWAHYNSTNLPKSAYFASNGVDQVAALVSAAHARGMKAHAWQTCFRLPGAPADYIAAMRAAVRTQVNSGGGDIDALCPTHPTNRTLTVESFREIANTYNLDGVHLDYIRYADGDSCYCQGCKTRFQTESGLTGTWPAHVLPGGAHRTQFLEWRRGKITSLVDAVYDAVKAVKPAMQVSAAVFSDYASAKDSVGQDWETWIDNGSLDFVCPMSYTASHSKFDSLLATNQALVAGRIPLYTGIGVHLQQSDGVTRQIEIVRERGAGGFTAFDAGHANVETILPRLGDAVLAPWAVDGFLYDQTEAQALWVRGGVGSTLSPPVEKASADAPLKLPCNFSVTNMTRCYWTRDADLDLTTCSRFALDVYVDNTNACSSFTLYFRSPGGWYGRSETLPAALGWNTLYIHRSAFGVEGSPAGWNLIDGIRLSPWRKTGFAQDAFFLVRNLRDASSEMGNRLGDGSFENGLGAQLDWAITSGSPTLDTNDKWHGDAALRVSKSTGAAQQTVKLNGFVPVSGGAKYVVSAYAKGASIVQGTSGWHRLYVIARWYDANLAEIASSYPDLPIPTGTFDWTRYATTNTAPASAKYYRITAAGLIGTQSSGTGWLDQVEFGLAP